MWPFRCDLKGDQITSRWAGTYSRAKISPARFTQNAVGAVPLDYTAIKFYVSAPSLCSRRKVYHVKQFKTAQKTLTTTWYTTTEMLALAHHALEQKVRYPHATKVCCMLQLIFT